MQPDKTATKHDSGKPPMHYLPSAALGEVAKAMEFGAAKYGDYNWRKGMAWSRLISAALRHVFAYTAGEKRDPESGLSHIAHAATCLLFLLDYEQTGTGNDDTYKA